MSEKIREAFEKNTRVTYTPTLLEPWWHRGMARSLVTINGWPDVMNHTAPRLRTVRASIITALGPGVEVIDTLDRYEFHFSLDFEEFEV